MSLIQKSSQQMRLTDHQGLLQIRGAGPLSLYPADRDKKKQVDQQKGTSMILGTVLPMSSSPLFCCRNCGHFPHAPHQAAPDGTFTAA